MGCDCSKAKSIPVCVTSLNVGKGDVDTDYFVVFKTADGRMDIYESTSDAFGNILVEDGSFRTNTTYEVWVALQPIVYVTTNIYEKETITVDATSVTCLYLEFRAVYESESVETFASQIVTLQ